MDEFLCFYVVISKTTVLVISRVTRMVFQAQSSYFVSKNIGGNTTVVTTKMVFKSSEHRGILRQYCKSQMGLSTAYRKYQTGGILTIIQAYFPHLNPYNALRNYKLDYSNVESYRELLNQMNFFSDKDVLLPFLSCCFYPLMSLCG